MADKDDEATHLSDITPRIDALVKKVGGLLPTEWTTDMYRELYDMMGTAYSTGFRVGYEVRGSLVEDH